MTRSEIISAINDAINRAMEEIPHERIFKTIKEFVEEACPEAKVIHPKRNWPYCASAGPMVTNFPECDSSVSEENWVLPLVKIQFPAHGTEEKK